MRLHDTYPTTRDALALLATHVLARAQHAQSGRIGLRATPGGYGTSVYGPDRERLRVSGGLFVRERAAASSTSSAAMHIDGATLAELALFAGVDLSTEFSVGHDTPPLGDPDIPLRVDTRSAHTLGEWYGLTAQALDRTMAGVPAAVAGPTIAQLWPEHFDIALDLAFDNSAPGERRVNLGGSPGDGFHDEPYLNVGPWTADRPGEVQFWNAPFGAIVGAHEIISADDPVAAATRFFRAGLERLAP